MKVVGLKINADHISNITVSSPGRTTPRMIIENRMVNDPEVDACIAAMQFSPQVRFGKPNIKVELGMLTFSVPVRAEETEKQLMSGLLQGLSKSKFDGNPIIHEFCSQCDAYFATHWSPKVRKKSTE